MDLRSAGLPVWFKSSRCESNHCAEVAHVGGGAAMRNSTVPHRQITFPAAAWAAFLTDVRTGRYDGPERP